VKVSNDYEIYNTTRRQHFNGKIGQLLDNDILLQPPILRRTLQKRRTFGEAPSKFNSRHTARRPQPAIVVTASNVIGFARHVVCQKRKCVQYPALRALQWNSVTPGLNFLMSPNIFLDRQAGKVKDVCLLSHRVGMMPDGGFEGVFELKTMNNHRLDNVLYQIRCAQGG
jgi:hypothetical protein